MICEVGHTHQLYVVNKTHVCRSETQIYSPSGVSIQNRTLTVGAAVLPQGADYCTLLTEQLSSMTDAVIKSICLLWPAGEEHQSIARAWDQLTKVELKNQTDGPPEWVFRSLSRWWRSCGTVRRLRWKCTTSWQRKRNSQFIHKWAERSTTRLHNFIP